MAQLHDVRGSGELRGVLAALRELLVADLPGVVEPPAVDLNLRRYLRANDEAVRWVGRGGPINLVLLSRLAGILAGERESLGQFSDDEVTEVGWRTGPAWLGGPEPRTAYLLAVPPGAELQTGGMQWSAWVDSGCEAPLLARVALGHYQLAALSPVPFADHLSRLFITLALIREGALSDPILPISDWLSRYRDEYRDRILALAGSGDVDGFLVFFGTGIAELCRSQMRFIHRAERVVELHLERIGRRMDGIVRVTRDLAATPLTTNTQIAERCGISVQHAASLTKQLKRMGLIRSLNGKPYRQVFVVPDVMDLFELNYPLPPDSDSEVFGD
ncbi:Fic family protein [Actinophytocola sp.]|uniref:Fic family protein n=1 Tax=Actinophytocola sp. TaxID=1872138 RepID=UPI002D7E612E|nr:winged helix-turn-helix transcriptional regulator [Actinophytocola sp.]HET9143516.1 winged helix-turn-helix transcriptional regulator [Actinophytocola sp.]